MYKDDELKHLGKAIGGYNSCRNFVEKYSYDQFSIIDTTQRTYVIRQSLSLQVAL